MADLVEYTVARGHQGDKITDEGVKVHKFAIGETRLAHPSVVANLVKSGHLVPPADKADKADKQPTEAKPEGGATETKPAPAAPVSGTKAKAAAKAQPAPAENKSEGNSTETKVEQPAANKGGDAVQTKAE